MLPDNNRYCRCSTTTTVTMPSVLFVLAAVVAVTVAASSDQYPAAAGSNNPDGTNHGSRTSPPPAALMSAATHPDSQPDLDVQKDATKAYNANPNNAEDQFLMKTVEAMRRHRFASKTSGDKSDTTEKVDGTGQETLTVPELQVGCADGFIRATLEQRADSSSSRHRDGGGWNALAERKLRKRAAARRNGGDVKIERRKRRAYGQWNSPVAQAPLIPSFSDWQVSPFQITRPYIIPVWGGPGYSIFFQPQPYNPGYPRDNPRESSFPPMGYLPPVPLPRPVPTPGTTTTTMTTPQPMWEDEDKTEIPLTEDRFPTDGPVWGVVATTTRSRPTRPPVSPGRTTTTPPLLHRNRDSDRNQVTDLSTGGGGGGGQQVGNPARPNQNRPPANNFQPPPRQQQPSPPSSSSSQQRPVMMTTRRPTTTTTTEPPARTPNGSGVQPRQQPSRCEWAIVSCCTAGSVNVSYECFERLGCAGPFWGVNPCSSAFAPSAFANVLKYYGK